jgi:small subunit ribosomal protein S17|tara:strand:- start:353 stop:748 length:396 start_codon:yes stop_codon:yes gene_type:complete
MVYLFLKGQKIELIENIGEIKMRDIGVDVNSPQGEWDGNMNCPFYGNLRVRGQIIEGIVSTSSMQNAIVVERRMQRYMTKYERYEKRTRRYSAHLPSCIGELNPGDKVRIMECRPLSKTIKFCVIDMEASK